MKLPADYLQVGKRVTVIESDVPEMIGLKGEIVGLDKNHSQWLVQINGWDYETAMSAYQIEVDLS